MMHWLDIRTGHTHAFVIPVLFVRVVLVVRWRLELVVVVSILVGPGVQGGCGIRTKRAQHGDRLADKATATFGKSNAPFP